MDREGEIGRLEIGALSDASQRHRRRSETTGGPAASPPADAASEVAALRAFGSANDRAATPAERKLLRDLAARFEPVAVAARQQRSAEDLPGSGWGWLEAAVWEAVEAGSAYLAPRRLREILLRWEREGFPISTDPPPTPEPSRGAPVRRSRRDEPLSEPRMMPPLFTVEEVGLSNRQVWAATLDEIADRGDVGRADLETWLRPAGLIGRDGETLIIGAPNAVARDRIATRLLSAVRDALSATIGVAVAVAVEIEGETARRQDGAAAS